MASLLRGAAQRIHLCGTIGKEIQKDHKDAISKILTVAMYLTQSDAERTNMTMKMACTEYVKGCGSLPCFKANHTTRMYCPLRDKIVTFKKQEVDDRIGL